LSLYYSIDLTSSKESFRDSTVYHKYHTSTTVLTYGNHTTTPNAILAILELSDANFAGVFGFIVYFDVPGSGVSDLINYSFSSTVYSRRLTTLKFG